MTAHKKLGALIVGAFLVLALGSGTALAGQGHQKKQKSEPGYSYYSQTRYVSTSNGAYKHGKSYGKRARNYYAWNGNDSRRANAYGKRGRNNYVYGNGYLFKPSHGDRRAQAYWRERSRDYRDQRHQHRWQGDSRFMSGQHDGQTDRRRDQRLFSGSEFGGSGDECFIKTRKKTVDGQKRLVTKEVCRGADGKTYTVPGSKVVQLLN